MEFKRISQVDQAEVYTYRIAQGEVLTMLCQMEVFRAVVSVKRFRL